MKKLLALALALALALVALAFYVRTTPHYAYFRLRLALADGDLPAAEEYADVNALAGVAVDVLAAMAEKSAGDAAGSLGATVARWLGAVVGEPLKVAVEPAVVAELKQDISRRRYGQQVGEFVFDSAWAGLSRVQQHDRSASVELTGTCRSGVAASVKVVFERRPSAWFGGWAPFRAVGLDRDSLVQLVRTCSRH